MEVDVTLIEFLNLAKILSMLALSGLEGVEIRIMETHDIKRCEIYSNGQMMIPFESDGILWERSSVL